MLHSSVALICIFSHLLIPIICLFLFLYRYCDHMLSPEIDNCVIDLLSDLHRFQTRAYLKDPIKVMTC